MLNLLKTVPLRIFFHISDLENLLQIDSIEELLINPSSWFWYVLLELSLFIIHQLFLNFVLHIDFSLFFEEKFHIYLRKNKSN